MKHTLSLLTLLGIASASQAALVWSEDFTQADGAFTDRAAAVGSGNIDVAGTVDIVNNAIVITPDGGSDRIEFESSAGALAGVFQFDLTITNGPDAADDIVFLQMVEGVARSTNGAPVNNFADTLDAGTHTIGSPSTIRYFFNVSGSDLDYTGPDGSSQTISTGAYDYWVDNTLTNGEQTQSGQSASAPTNGVDTFILQAFNQQIGETITIDNASLNTIAIPEPSSIALLGLGALGLLRRRR